MTLEGVDIRTTASAALFITCCVAVAASFAAALDSLLKLSIFDCCSFILELKSAIDWSHHLAKSLRKPRLSPGAADKGGGGCGGSVKPEEAPGGGLT